MTHHLDVVFLDVGGTIYDDVWYSRALTTALRELGAEFTDQAFAEEYERLRRAPGGSFRRLLAERFLGERLDVAAVEKTMAKHWSYPAEALYPEVLDCLKRLSEDYRLGIIADQERTIHDALRRDGVESFIDVWCISADIGMEKPDYRVFTYALTSARATDPSRAVMVGDRLDDDIRPSRDVGMRAVWVLTGKAPPEPTEDQLAEPDLWIRDLSELPDALERL